MKTMKTIKFLTVLLITFVACIAFGLPDFVSIAGAITIAPILGAVGIIHSPKELREQRAALAIEMQLIINSAKKENRHLTAEEQTKWDKMYADTDKLKTQYETLERQEKLDAEMLGRALEGAKTADLSTDEYTQKRSEVFAKWIKRGLGSLTEEERAIHGGCKDVEGRAQSTTDSAGGYTIPQGFIALIEKAMLWWGGMLEAGTIVPTSTGQPLDYPTNNDTSNKGALLSENSAATEQDTVFGNILINAYNYTTKLIRVSNQLLTDSAFNLEKYLAEIMAERIARIINEHFTTGTGTGQPNGIVTAATDSAITSVGVASITRNNILDLMFSVDKNYRKRGQFMFNDNTLKAIMKLTIGASDSRPLWQPGVIVGAPDTLEGKPYTINDDMADLGASAKSMLFGDTKKYLMRHVAGMVMRRLSERYAEYNQTGFVGFDRWDGELLDAGTNPVKYLVHPAS